MPKKGRPSKYDEIDLEKVRKLAEMGWSDLQMSDFFGIHVATWYRWKLEHEDFCDALKNWKEHADERVERTLYERALGYSHTEDKIFKDSEDNPLIVPTVKHYPPDPTSMIFWLKNRQPDKWRDKREVDVADTTPIVSRKRFDGSLDDTED